MSVFNLDYDDLIKSSPSELYPEISLNCGNFCPCGTLDPYKKTGIAYLACGFGCDQHLIKNIYLHLGFHVYRPFRNVASEEFPYASTQYIVGVSYKLGSN